VTFTFDTLVDIQSLSPANQHFIYLSCFSCRQTPIELEIYYFKCQSCLCNELSINETVGIYICTFLKYVDSYYFLFLHIVTILNTCTSQFIININDLQFKVSKVDCANHSYAFYIGMICILH